MGAITYNADIYLAETGAAFKQRYVELLNAMVAAPEQAIGLLLDREKSASAKVLARLAARSDSEHDDEVVAAAVARDARPMALLPPEQARLAQVWASALGIDVNEIRPTDNFFDLGGDSLLAMRVVQQSEQAFGQRIEARRYLFESLAQLAASQVSELAPLAPVDAPSAARPGLLGRVFSAWSRKG